MSLAIVRQLADSENPTSFGNRLREKRFRRFESLVGSIARPMRILDLGGTNSFWENRGWANRPDVEIVTLNLVREDRIHSNITPLAGDATDLTRFGERSFDVVFSNSVIEHLFTFANQARMASGIRRVGKAYWVQTPNFWFPIEPHFHVPGWQWMPRNMRVSLIRRWRCGWRGPCSDVAGARMLVDEIRLLRKKELRALFPDATLIAERFSGFVKSWVAVAGFSGLGRSS